MITVSVAQEVFDAESILLNLRNNLSMQLFELEGVIRHKKNFYPLTLKTGPNQMEYHFSGHEPKVRIIFTTPFSQVWIRSEREDQWKMLPEEGWDYRVLGTDVTYRDLALDFLNWRPVYLLGKGSAKTLPAYVLEAWNSSARPSGIEKVKFWVSCEHFVLVQAEAYNSDGEVVRRLDVNGVQRIGDFWTIKEMCIAEMIPKRNLSRSRTFIEINSGKQILSR